MRLFGSRRRQMDVRILMDRASCPAAPTPPARERVRAEAAARPAGPRAQARIAMCACAFALVFSGLVLRHAGLALGGGGEEGAARVAAAPEGPRGEIVDRNGALLAADLPMRALEVDGRDVWDAAETARLLAFTLPRLDEADVRERVARGRWVEIADDLTPAEARAVFALGLPGVHLTNRTKRFYPNGALAAHVLGHTEDGRGGVMGLEKTLDGVDGGLAASIDIRAQQILEEELEATVEKFSAEAGWGVVIEATTGEVLALANVPDFDPNHPGAAAPDARRNRAAYDLYELGSAFKSFTAAAALDSGAARFDQTYDARRPLRVADRVIRDFHPERRVLTFSEVLQYSSNIGAAMIAADLGPERQREYLAAFGMLDALRTDIPERRAPMTPMKWGPVEAATVSYGHGIAVTPLHLAAGYAALVNGGEWRAPQFVHHAEPTPGRRVISPQTSAQMRLALRRVVAKGTARKADAPGYYLIGKTATADKPSDTGGYRRDARISSFVGAFPGYDPKYVVLVTLDEPQPLKETYGYATSGWNAAPLARALVERLAPIYGVRPVDEVTALARFYEMLEASDGLPAQAASFTPAGASGEGAFE